jgi:AcrR family transcriptional regulator
MDPRALRVRTALLSSAWTLAHAQRIESISVVAICRHADVSRQVFYKHFADRDEVVFAAVRASFDEAVAGVVGDPLQPLVAWMREHGELERNLYPSQVADRLGELLRDTLRPLCEAALPARIDATVERADAVCLLVGGMWELLRQIALGGVRDGRSPADLRALLDLIGQAWASTGSARPAPDSLDESMETSQASSAATRS